MLEPICPTTLRVLAPLFALALAAACGKKDASPDSPHYDVRGQVAARDATSLVVHHEAIPEFRDQDGERVGMASMKMRFQADKGVSLDAIEVDDKVRMTIRVDWPKLIITELETLPKETTLSL